MRRVQVDFALSFVGGGVVNGTTDERQSASATTETRSRCDGGRAGGRAGGRRFFREHRADVHSNGVVHQSCSRAAA
jgi:hypothetical protein